jgi:hypothetical protein
VSCRVECRPTTIKPPKDPFTATRYPQSGAYKRRTSSQEPPIRVAHSVALHHRSLDLSDPMIARGIHNSFHANPLRPNRSDPGSSRTPGAPLPVQFPDGHLEHEVDKILRFRLHRGKPQYLVHSKGYGENENSWLLAVDLSSPEILADFSRAADGSPQRGR